MIPTIEVNATTAYAKFSRSGIPEQVRSNLRSLLPDLGKAIGASIESKLDTRLQSRTNLAVTKKMIEDPRSVRITISTVWLGDPAKALVPLFLEVGTRPHVIEARFASVLAFYWPKIGGWFFGPRVNHPGTPPYRYTQDTLEQEQENIVDTLDRAVKDGVR